ncbi:MAG: hypothetical protein CL578_14775 [Alteromonadaceae bacterium]|uniref:MrcB family domain-containing protein n=1 Tax=Paraglaciecola chathamensis TaxID=368405 RepID=UPI000C45D30D|nr:DUF3578 domain-containing protein [Paraglaciecola agarilytica]MBN26302.1 hypothetical protein [Alteromonadaceae bacterium]|tara:strand:- start:106208 stop:107272 length:1065 start_codon:yes stop_codon:yes gene_type:complete
MNIISDICELQHKWTSENTSDMQLRGKLIRDDFADELKSLLPALNKSMGSRYNDLTVEGKDGIGRKTDVPWARFFSKSRSHSATKGWYCVYLFRRDGKGVYLSLAHGSTRFVNGSFVERSSEELDKLITWARQTIQEQVAGLPGVIENIDLGSTLKLAKSYEKSIVFAKYYPVDTLPSLSEFESDACTFASLLDALYYGEEMGRAPDQPDTIVDYVASMSRGVSRGQGFNLSGPERKEVELRAMRIALDYLNREGYSVVDVSSTKPYDYEATAGGEVFSVEVKGTTSGLGSIVLTRNEVKHHRNKYPNNMLLVVTGIDLEKGDNPSASGGSLTVYCPWEIDNDKLQVLSYQYQL